MKKNKIYIEGINPDGSLKLSDKGLTKTVPTDTVEWIIDKNSCVASISSIHDTSSVEVFKPLPKKMPGNSGNWMGTINPNLSPLPQTEHYSIYYTKKGGTTVYTDDPRIQVDSVIDNDV